MPHAPQPSPSSSIVAQLRRGVSPQQFRKATLDLKAGWQRRELWGTMGVQDIRQRYRRSVLGPFWITISMGIMIGALGTLWGTLFKQDMSHYLPFLATGLLLWGFISGLLLESTQVFSGAEGTIRQIPAPLSIHVYRLLWSNLIIFSHNLWILPVVALWYKVHPGWPLLLAIPALILLIFNGFWMVLLLGMLCARFRDIPPVVSSAVQVLFFITPVMWIPEMLPSRGLILDLNPFYHLIEIVREPLLGQTPVAGHWIASLLFALGGWAITLVFFSTFRWRLPYWL